MSEPAVPETPEIPTPEVPEVKPDPALTAAQAQIAELQAKVEAAAAADADRTAKAEAAALEKRKQEGDVLTLLEETQAQLAAAKEKATTLEARETTRLGKVSERNDAVLADLADDLKDLIPEGLDPDTLAVHLRKLAAHAGTSAEPRPVGGRKPTARTPKPTIPEACKAQAAKHKMSPEWWYEKVWLKRNPPQADA